VNGGIIGPANIPTQTTASGVWTLEEQFLAMTYIWWFIGQMLRADLVSYQQLTMPCYEPVLNITDNSNRCRPFRKLWCLNAGTATRETPQQFSQCQ
jgi:hypothetical protein